MKTAEEWHLIFEQYTDANGCVPTDAEQSIVRAIQREAIGALAEKIVEALQGDYYLEQSEGTVRDAARALKSVL